LTSHPRVYVLGVELTPADHKPFLSDNFDVNSYANAVLSGRVYDPEASTSSEPNGTAKPMKGREVEKGDVGVELARLSYGIVSLRPDLASLC
jgi:hypothetical protein